MRIVYFGKNSGTRLWPDCATPCRLFIIAMFYIIILQIADLANEDTPQLYTLCGRGPRSSLRVLRHGLEVREWNTCNYTTMLHWGWRFIEVALVRPFLGLSISSNRLQGLNLKRDDVPRFIQGQWSTGYMSCLVHSSSPAWGIFK